MNSAWNRPALCLLAGLALAGCTDHGPVGLFSAELFNKNVAPPKIDYNSASSVTFTVTPGFADSAFSTLAAATVYVANSGGCPTYGPLRAVFSSADTALHLQPLNGVVEAYGANSAGQEVPNNANLVTLLRGYRQNGTDIVADPTYSLVFWYAVPAYSSPLPVDHPVFITMVNEDGIGNSWTTQFAFDIRY